ncbi:MAG: hypothetical protein HYX97_03335 [Chloroflexi bacterium]|nr:hypothetical protein [Chloroflexota bacterium]
MAVGEGSAEGVGLGSGEGEGNGVGLGVGDGVGEGVGVAVGTGVGAKVGRGTAVVDGVADAVTVAVGVSVGLGGAGEVLVGDDSLAPLQAALVAVTTTNTPSNRQRGRRRPVSNITLPSMLLSAVDGDFPYGLPVSDLGLQALRV